LEIVCPIEKLLPGSLDFCLDFGLGLSQVLNEQIWVNAGLEGLDRWKDR
jgi:hypothetical protein